MDRTGMVCLRVIGSTFFFLVGHKAGLAHLCCLQPDTLPEDKVKTCRLNRIDAMHLQMHGRGVMHRKVQVVAMQFCKRLNL